MDFFGGVLAALGVFLPIVVAQYLLLRKEQREDKRVTSQLTQKERAALVREQRTENRIALDEYRELYQEVKAELEEVRASERNLERRVALLEARLVAAGIPLPAYPDDTTSGEHPSLPGGS